ncbi:MAG: hypothetical protein LT080_13510 [Thiobacillus sp.]|nr:hypothetical protein [Thiobacillus sp.]
MIRSSQSGQQELEVSGLSAGFQGRGGSLVKYGMVFNAVSFGTQLGSAAFFAMAKTDRTNTMSADRRNTACDHTDNLNRSR